MSNALMSTLLWPFCTSAPHLQLPEQCLYPLLRTISAAAKRSPAVGVTLSIIAAKLTQVLTPAMGSMSQVKLNYPQHQHLFLLNQCSECLNCCLPFWDVKGAISDTIANYNQPNAKSPPY
jgi:hypothetical protein